MSSRICTTALLIVLFTTLVGCRHKSSTATDDIENQFANLYTKYLTGSVDQARESLQQTIALADKADLAAPARAKALWITYARMFALERYSKNDPAADLCFVKARYWFLRRLELAHHSIEEADQEIKGWTPDKCLE